MGLASTLVSLFVPRLNRSSIAKARVKRVKAILMREPLPSPLRQLLEELACDEVDPRLIDAAFPGLNPNVSIQGVRPVRIHRTFSDREVTTLLRKQGLKVAAPDKAIRWAAENRDFQRSETLVAFHRRRFNRRFTGAIVLGGWRHHRSILVGDMNDLWLSAWVMAEPMTPAELRRYRAVRHD